MMSSLVTMVVQVFVIALMTATTAVHGLEGSVLRRTLVKIPVSIAIAAAQPAVADVPVDPFNSMCLGFGCNSPRGVDEPGLSKPLEEDSIDWASFLRILDDGGVASVEFEDVTMAKAWAFLKPDDEAKPLRRIRIGEGYPLDAGDSWSSTLFVARILQNKQVGYSFMTGLKRRS
ncbi:hypothetical protein CTAYLR_003939 [Chrysophaeum taylorii]|uniref:Uncharacterized protein n=1 Tax=Chrysophaeum taylorii TaxID=2483200 RepID=A0AAD7XGN8_9STRA|nr:hypothetical protein CTAYLR_003939 [Chrysophaeum taylorii]